MDPPPNDVDPDLIVQRPDDQPDTIRNRLSVYHEQTAPLKAYYRERGIYQEVDGVGDIDAIYQRIADTLEAVSP
jgi:adenylate kinase